MKVRHVSLRKMQLYLLNELPHADWEKIEIHLQDCAECRISLNGEKKLQQLLRQQSRWIPENAVLQKLRARLMRRIKIPSMPNSQEGIRESVIAFLRPVGGTRMQWAATALIFCLGLAAGRIIPFQKWLKPSAAAEAVEALQSSQAVSDFQIVPAGAGSDKVEIRFRTIRNQVLRGALDDPAVQSALLYVLKHSPGDSERLRTIDLLSKFKSTYPEVQEALIHALEKDGNPGVRLKAIKLLIGVFPINEALKTVLVRVLIRDANEGIRVEAANMLNRLSDPDVLPILKKEASGNEYIRYLLMNRQ